MAKATHYGTCQICGARQKLPNGVLAKHGYTVEYSFFNGVCPGAGYLPLEVSCDQIEKVAVSMGKQADRIKASADELIVADYAGVTKAWKNVYRKSGNRFIKTGYVWAEVEVKFFVRPNGEVSYTNGTYTFENDTFRPAKIEKNRFDLYNYKIDSAEKAILEFNTKYAVYLLKQVASIHADIERLNDILKNWAPKPLTPVEA